MSALEVRLFLAGSTASILTKRARDAGQAVDKYVLDTVLDRLGIEYVNPYHDELHDALVRRRREVERMHALGMNLAEIATAVGYEQSTIRRDLDALGIRTTRTRKAS